jgi:flagellar biosynthesis protein FlhF
MRLKTYRAASVVEAMAMIRAELGADALIVSSRRSPTGIEIAACLDPQDDEPPPPRHASPEQANGAAYGATAAYAAAQNAQWLPKPAPGRAAATESATECLAWHGIPPALATRLTAPLAQTLAGLLQFGTLPIGATAPLLLAGAPGAGKTLTTARLATRLVLAGHLPLVISADGRRAGAAEELAAYTRLLGLELIVASKPATVARALQRRPPGAAVLIDTAGVSPFDPAQVEGIAALIAAAGALPVLVLAAGQNANEAADQAEIFAAIGVRHLVPTRLDMVRRLGAIVTAAHAGSLILSEAGTGPGATDGLTQITPAILAERLSRMSATGHASTPRQADHARHV